MSRYSRVFKILALLSVTANAYAQSACDNLIIIKIINQTKLDRVSATNLLEAFKEFTGKIRSFQQSGNPAHINNNVYMVKILDVPTRVIDVYSLDNNGYPLYEDRRIISAVKDHHGKFQLVVNGHNGQIEATHPFKRKIKLNDASGLSPRLEAGYLYVAKLRKVNVDSISGWISLSDIHTNFGDEGPDPTAQFGTAFNIVRNSGSTEYKIKIVSILARRKKQ